MATKIGQELTALSFLQGQTRLADGNLGFDTATLDGFVKRAEAYERELKRVFGSIVTTVSEIDKLTGQMKRTSFIPKEYEQQALGVIKAVQDQRSTWAQDSSFMYTATNKAHILETTREIKGAKAQQFAKEELLAVGGRLQHTAGTSNKDMMTSFIPVLDSDLSNMSKTDIAKYIRGLTPHSNSASIAEAKDRSIKENANKIAEQEKQERELKRNQEKQEREHESQLEQNYRRKKAVDKENANKTAEQEREFKRSQKEKEKEQREEEKEKAQQRKALFSSLGKIGTTIAVLTDITRRILTSVLSFGSTVSKEGVQAHTLETSYQTQRAMAYFDRAVGLGAGTSLQAQEDLRAKFGNTAKLDTEALKWLAMVMGDEVSTMVMSGLGGENPAKLMERILDDFYKRQQEGKDQYGNVVGQDKARRALVTLLESVSPSIARVFERMVEEQSNGLNAGTIKNYAGFQSLYLPSSGGLTGNDWDMISLLGKEVDELRAKFKNLGDTLKGSFMLALQGVIGWLNGRNIGQTSTESFESAKSDSEFLRERQAKLKGRRDVFKKSLSKYFGDRDIYDVIKRAGYEESTDLTPEQNKDIREAKATMQSVFQDTDAYNDLELYLGTEKQIADITTDINKGKSADKAKYSDIGLIQTASKEGSTYLDILGYSRPSEFKFAENDFRGKTWFSLQESGFRFEDIVPERQAYVANAGLEYIKNMLSLDKDNKNPKKNPRWQAFASALSALGLSEEDVMRLMTDPTGANLSKLMEIYTKIISPNSTRKVKYGGIGADTKGREWAVSFLANGSDSFGLNNEEWLNIYEMQKKARLQASNENFASKIGGFNYEYRKGATGQIEMIVRVVDNNGKELSNYKYQVAGTLEQDFKQTVDGSFQKLSN